METLRGIVEAVKNTPAAESKIKKDTFGIKVNNEWYNGFGVSPVQKGDTVLLEYEINGQYKNVRTAKVAGSADQPEKKISEPIARVSFEDNAKKAVEDYAKVYALFSKAVKVPTLDGEVSAVTACFIEAKKKTLN